MRRGIGIASALLVVALAHCGGRAASWSSPSFTTPPCDPGDGTSACDVEGTTCFEDSETCRCTGGSPICPTTEKARCASGNASTGDACITLGLTCDGAARIGECMSSRTVCTCDGFTFTCTPSLCSPVPRDKCPSRAVVREGASCPLSLQHTQCDSNERCDELPASPSKCVCENERWTCAKPCRGGAGDASPD